MTRIHRRVYPYNRTMKDVQGHIRFCALVLDFDEKYIINGNFKKN